MELPQWGCGTSRAGHRTGQEVTKLSISGTCLESQTTEGDSPVHENIQPSENVPE